MAESKSALLAKTVQKHAGRAKEKVFIFLCYLTYCVLVGMVMVFSRILPAKCRESGFLTGLVSRWVGFHIGSGLASTRIKFHLLLAQV